MLSKAICFVIAAFSAPLLLAQASANYPPPPQSSGYPPPRNAPITPPAAIRVCANPADWSKCGTWVWENGHYAAWREWGAHASVEIRSFTAESVIFRRTDTGTPGPGHPGAGFWQDYSGSITNGNSILDGRSAASDHTSGTFRAYWGEAMLQHPEMTPDQWTPFSTAEIPCDPRSFRGNAGEAAERGGYAVQKKDMNTAVCWLRIGSEGGNADAQAMLAAILYKGLSGSPSYPQAFTLASKSAIQDNYIAAEVLARMYESGQGVTKDPQAGSLWRSKIDDFKSEYNLQQQFLARIRQQGQQVAQAQRIQEAVVGLVFLGAAAAILSGGESSSPSSGPRVCEVGHWVNQSVGNGRTWFCDRYSK